MKFEYRSLLPVLLIYVGTLFYTIASFYHLKFHGEEWTFFKAFAIAMPLVALEYTCSLHGNYMAHSFLGMSSMQILILTICFYFVNLWMLNIVVLKHRVDIRQVIAFILVVLALGVSGISLEYKIVR